MPSHPGSENPGAETAAVVDLTAAIIAVSNEEPRILTVGEAGRNGGDGLDSLPSGPLEPGDRTLEAGLRRWVERQTGQTLGYVEQLYTFGDRNRALTGPAGPRVLSIGYLALVREARPAQAEAAWKGWYRYLPWEDWRDGRPEVLDRLQPALVEWAGRAPTKDDIRLRENRLGLTFGLHGGSWNDERVLERYELLYEAGLVPEAHRDGAAAPPECAGAAVDTANPMTADHRRILATAIGRLRGKIKYRPVVFELMPPAFTLLQLQRTVEALAGVRLHKPNFRRLVKRQGLVEETGETALETGGRPASLVRFRQEVTLERPAPGVRLPIVRRTG
ncbi:NUDIX hydrolase [Ferruginivarius sediminum]|uniref:NrtR DNA-binding winged helix domain-containing protein n=1 Tax=Ferruginivarius sediminum TaxID=2661937 RepID=A0A369T8X3_9PROT|nr:hypothetical protein [Ferruginivarius sediminum]RDD60815.1 hypothetical protein DRB17_15900 [Ferruginivarius sediminum]